MRFALLAAVAVTAVVPVTIAAPAHADEPPPPYIERTEWVHWADLTSLRVYPTISGREASTDFASPDEAWSEVLAYSPDANLPGMREQFVCHWQLAEYALPGKPSWNLEPWRPLVDPAKMLETGCNPGGFEEPI
jgi:Protein of unknown function (DUF2599)